MPFPPSPPESADPPVAVVPWIRARGFSPQRRDPWSGYVVTPLRAALARTYVTDACMVMYVVDGASRQPRINKPGLPLWTGGTPRVHCFACDVDNPGHALWDDETFTAARGQDCTLPSLATAGVYYTPSGRRVLQPLTEAIAVPEAELHLGAWIDRLRAEGLDIDTSCKDWTRQFRLPHTRRPVQPDGRIEHVRSRCVDLARMVAIAPPPVPTVALESARPPRPERRLVTQVPATYAPIDARWTAIVERLARAVGSVDTEWHSLFLAIAGALLRNGVPAEELPALVRAIAVGTGRDARAEDRESGARTTLERAAAGQPFSAYGSLRARWPAVADALDEAFVAGLPGAPAPPSPAPTPPTLAETLVALETAIERAPDGLTLIKAECGLGKTAVALRVMSRRASRPYASKEAKGLRAPPRSKSALAVDKHSLALQCMDELARVGTQAKRFFGPLSLDDDEGEPVCRFRPVAEPLVAGGQRMQWELCDRRGADVKCPHFEGCRAREGVEGPDDARLAVGPHALVSHLDAHAGKSGLLVIDEIQDFLETTSFTTEDFELALAHAPMMFDGRFVAALEPAVRALRDYLAHASLDHPADALAAVRGHANAVPDEVLAQARRSAAVAGDLIDCAVAAPFPDGHSGSAPPLLHHIVQLTFHDPRRAQRIGRVSSVLRAVHQALASEVPVAARVEERHGKRLLLLTAPREALAKALRREGSVVVLDANVDLHAPVLARIVGYEPPTHVFTAPDGAPVHRTLHRTRTANRKAWFERGQLTVTAALVGAVRVAAEWISESTATRVVGLITFGPLETALRYCLGPEREAWRSAWHDEGRPLEALEALDSQLGPMLGACGRAFQFGHYGATRGLNAMADADALVTLGDPWRNLGDAYSDAAYLGLGNWRARYEAWCRAELEQAHGRLRTVHRTKPGRALHVGAVMPGGSGWTPDRVDIRMSTGGRPRQTAAMSVERLEEAIACIGGVGLLAAAIGCDRRSLRNYRVGERAIPPDLAARIEVVLSPGHGNETPLIEREDLT